MPTIRHSPTRRSSVTRSTLVGAALVGVCLWVLSACDAPERPGGLTPIEESLRADSLYRATLGDSAAAHIAFDYENLNRVSWQKPDVLLERLGPLEGKTVIEVGSGTGFFTRRLARRAGHVIALDIDANMLLVLDSVSQRELDTAAYARIDPRLVPPDDPKLGAAEGDAAMVVNTFMYIQDRPTYLQRLARGLKPGALVLIVDFKREETPVGPPVATRLPLTDVVSALRAANYTDIATDVVTLDYQYVVTARTPERQL